MAIAGKACTLTILIILCFALAYCEAYAKGVVRGVPDTFRGSNLARHDVPTPGEKVFNVLQFGAKPDGRKDNTQAFIKAWRAACDFKGPSRLLIPAGSFLLSQVTFGGPCGGTTPKIVQILGTLKGSTDISEYPEAYWIVFESIVGLVVTGSGKGTLDGQGDSVWKYNDCSHSSNCQPLPSNLRLNKVTNGVIRSLNSLNSKGVHVFITNCEIIRARNLHIDAPADSPNTDGIHVSHSNDVRIAKSSIHTGDDCVSIIQGATNIRINKVTCGPGHGISVGSLGKYENEEDVKGITVKNCTLVGTDNGVRIKSYPGSKESSASSMLFQDIIMNNVKNPIIIDQGYCPNSKCSNKSPSRVRLSDIHYINIRGTSSTPNAVELFCSSQYPCQNVQLFNIDLKSQQRGPTAASCTNAKVRFGGKMNPPPCK
ncbi:hypothetical protein ACB098_02G051800 [Castanea mollissima]|uniref:Polygalacturonase n=1 Tax=Castanea mollissima TaxID=60419 RepID=A0A8J4VA75_9ROSI|nr:hypothetical protein CMV_023874 [Castanea mollissima]